MLDMTLVNQIETVLPDSLLSHWHALKLETVENSEKLTVCLLGAFSVGKSSLINMLIGKDYLSVAQQETTALPTFIKYAESETFLLQSREGIVENTTLEVFQKVITQHEGGYHFATLSLPLNWMKDLYLVDLPGLGSMSEQHREYTRAQIRSTDIVLYLLQPRGPDAEDLKMLQFIVSLGKPVKILIAQWDSVLEAVKLGEKMPSLEKWASQIQEVTGELAVLLPVSKTGIGRSGVLDYLDLIQTDSMSIRAKRFYSEAVLLLQTAVERLSEQKEMLNANLFVQDQSQKDAILQKRTEMLELKRQIHQKLQQEQQQIEQQWRSYIMVEKQVLNQNLEQIKNHLLHQALTKENWQIFIEEGHAQFDLCAQKLAIEASTIAKQYGNIDLPELAKKQLNVRFPEIEKIEKEAFSQAGRMQILKDEFAEVTAKLDRIMQEKETQPDPQSLSELEQYKHEIRQLEEVKKELMGQHIPKIDHIVNQGSNLGSTMGRTFGAIVDIGLIFIAPQTIGTKVASIFGKGVTAMQGAKKGSPQATLLQKTKNSHHLLGKMIEHTGGFLQTLSVEYWFEKVGSRFDKPPRVESVVDLQAITEMEIEKQDIMAQIQERKNKLQHLENQRQELEDNAFIQKQHEHRAAQLREQIAQREHELQKRQEQAEQDAALRQKQLFANQIEQALTQWIGQFDYYASGIEAQLFYLFKIYAEKQVESALETYENHLVSLEEKLMRSPQERQAAEQCVTTQIEQVTQYRQQCQKYATMLF